MLDKTLAARLEAADAAGALAHTQTRARLEPESNCRWQEVGDGLAVYSGHASPIRGITGWGMARPVTAQEVRDGVAFFAALGLPAPVHLCPLADPSLLSALAPMRQTAVAFKHMWVRDAAAPLAAPLAAAPEGAAAGAPASAVQVQEARGRAALRLWAQVVDAAFHDDEVLEDMGLSIAGINTHSPGVRCFLATVDGEPAGGGALAVRDGLGVFFSTATRPRFRRRGVQAALLGARIAAARAAGCDLVAVQTVPGSASQRNVERFGFRIAYTRVTLNVAAY